MNLYKKKIRKQKRRLFISVAASLFALSVIVSSIFAVVTYNAEKQLLFSQAYSDWSDMLVNLQNIFQEPYINSGNLSTSTSTSYYAEYYMNTYLSQDEQVFAIDNNGVTVAETKNALPVDFSSYPYYREEGTGCIDYTTFRSSMTDEQYKKITDYLSQGETEDSKYYELLCTYYYYYKGNIIPKTLEIVETKEENVWYVQDEIIERFELNMNIINSTIMESATLYKNGDMQRNVIDKEFVFGNYSRENIIDHILSHSEDIPKTDNNIFYYTYSIDNNEYTIFASNVYVSGSEGRLYDYEGFSYIYFNISSFSMRTSDNNIKTYTVYYAKSFDVLESCFDSIAFIFIYIFALFAIVGIILAAVIWHTMKRQITQEEKLRITTNAMAHDLKTPLFIISGYAENLKENIHTDKREHYADVICEQTTEMNLLIHQMLDFSRLEGLNYQLNTEEFDLVELTAELLDKYAGINLEQDIEFVYDKTVMLKAEKRLIKSSLENLIDNAIKYSDKQKAISIEINDKRFTITNSCNTISKKELKQIWEPYRRIDDHNDKKGNGLGLSIVKTIFDLHKFKYGAKYRDGFITFWFRWK